MFKIRRDDTIQVIRGDDRGKKGKVLRIFPEEKRAIVEGINLVKKHKRKTQQDQQGGVVSIEAPIDISNLALFCKHCNRPARIGFMVSGDGLKSRVCRKCKEVI
jgi:large subunit ribosomal protein L24